MIRWIKSLFAWRYCFTQMGWRYEFNDVTGQHRALFTKGWANPRDVDIPWLKRGKGECRINGRRFSHWLFDRQMEEIDQ